MKTFGHTPSEIDLVAYLNESEQLISAKPALASDYELGSISLYRNARKEGIPV
jgi:hypothetical protein